MHPNNLSVLSRSASAPVASVPYPRSRFATRVLVPALVVLAALGLLAYAARESLRASIAVRTAPVVLKVEGASGGSAAAAGEIVQAPGWIEADPYAISVPALVEGVIRDVPVLEGETVQKDQVVARLIDDDAVLSRKRAEADLARANAAIEEARAAVAMEEAKAEEARDASERIAPLTSTGAVGEGEIVARRLRLATQRAAVATANAAARRAEAEYATARVMLEEAELALSRTQVRSPVAGVVLVRLVEPGQRLMPDANNPFAGVVLRLYDPNHLQVRIDIPLADAAKVTVGDAVEITTETLPDRVFHGTISRFVNEANLQKNTMQVKVAIADPAPQLKPEMLAKARIVTRGREASVTLNGESQGGSGSVLLAPRASIVEIQGTQGAAWVVDLPTSTAQKRQLHLGRITAESVEVLDGLRPGDRVIVQPPANLADGTKVRATEATEEH